MPRKYWVAKNRFCRRSHLTELEFVYVLAEYLTKGTNVEVPDVFSEAEHITTSRQTVYTYSKKIAKYLLEVRLVENTGVHNEFSLDLSKKGIDTYFENIFDRQSDVKYRKVCQSRTMQANIEGLIRRYKRRNNRISKESFKPYLAKALFLSLHIRDYCDAQAIEGQSRILFKGHEKMADVIIAGMLDLLERFEEEPL